MIIKAKGTVKHEQNMPVTIWRRSIILRMCEKKIHFSLSLSVVLTNPVFVGANDSESCTDNQHSLKRTLKNNPTAVYRRHCGMQNSEKYIIGRKDGQQLFVSAKVRFREATYDVEQQHIQKHTSHCSIVLMYLSFITSSCAMNKRISVLMSRR